MTSNLVLVTFFLEVCPSDFLRVLHNKRLLIPKHGILHFLIHQNLLCMLVPNLSLVHLHLPVQKIMQIGILLHQFVKIGSHVISRVLDHLLNARIRRELPLSAHSSSLLTLRLIRWFWLRLWILTKVWSLLWRVHNVLVVFNQLFVLLIKGDFSINLSVYF